MKKILLTLMAACAVFSFASAQETGFGFGVKAGVNISNQTLDDAAKYKAGFTGGVFVDYRTCNWFAVSVDVLYSRQGSKIENSDIKLRTDYLNRQFLSDARHGAENRRSARLPAGGQSERRRRQSRCQEHI